MQMERRYYPFEVRVSDGQNGDPVISGTGIVYNQLSMVIWGMFREQIKPGAFSESIAKRDVKTLWNHNSDYPLGRTGNGTMRVQEGEDGISFDNDPPDTSWGKDAVASIRRRDVTQMSFGFVTIEDDWSIDNENQLIRTIVKGELWEMSPVTFPAYPQTDVAVRSVEGRKGLIAALYNENPTIPDWVRAHLEGEKGGDEGQVRAHLDLLRRRLDLI